MDLVEEERSRVGFRRVLSFSSEVEAGVGLGAGEEVGVGDSVGSGSERRTLSRRDSRPVTALERKFMLTLLDLYSSVSLQSSPHSSIS